MNPIQNMFIALFNNVLILETSNYNSEDIL